MPGCAVYGCLSYSRTTKGSNIKYYSFPKDDNLRKLWVTGCQRKDTTYNIKNARVCSLHFEDSCFQKTLKQQMLNYLPRNSRNLRKDAVPSRNLPGSELASSKKSVVEEGYKYVAGPMKMKIVTCIAPVNIAVIKYWGKRDESLVLPINDSLSCTLSTDFMCAKTTILASPLLKENKFWLNGKEQSFDNDRLNNCVKEVKRRTNPLTSSEILNWNFSICSVNNFPTAAGLASSAAGYACLVSALCALYGVEGDVSGIARRGSGSACRSVYGGWVQWCKGTAENGSDSIAKQIVPAVYWPEMRVLILVVNDSRKKYSSTSGMKRSVETSTLLKHRAENIVPKRIEAITKAIQLKDFPTFARITMQDSNQFHAICLDTFPPCVYMNDVSHAIVEMVHAYNEYRGSNKVAYTFDAGPNACLYLLESEVEEFLSIVNYTFPPPPVDLVEYIRGLPVTPKITNQQLKNDLNVTQHEAGQLKYIIHTKVGNGPKILTNPYEHLLTEAGLPKSL